MSVITENYLDVTNLFWPVDIAPPNDIPLTVTDIRKVMREVAPETDHSEYAFIIKTYEDDERSLEMVSNDLTLDEMLVLSVTAAGKIYGSDMFNEENHSLCWSDSLVESCFVMKV